MKRIFGGILTVIGTGCLFYVAISFFRNLADAHEIKNYLIFSVVGLLFSVAGIGAIRTIKIEQKL